MKIAIDAAAKDRRTRVACLNGILEGVVLGNIVLMKREQFPPLYAAGVRYKREPRIGPWHERERWLYCTQVLAERFADCEDLAAWRAAELRLMGEPARALLVPVSARTLHAVVIRMPPGGQPWMEDPSRILGMGKGTIDADDPHAQPPTEQPTEQPAPAPVDAGPAPDPDDPFAMPPTGKGWQ